MRVFVMARPDLLHPFGMQAQDCALGPETFEGYRARTLRALGLPQAEVINDDDEITGPALVIAADTWVTKRALAGFLKASAGITARLALPPSRMLDLYAPLQDLQVADGGRAAFDVATVAQGERTNAKALFDLPLARWKEPPYREILLEVPVPRHLMGRQEAVLSSPLTSTVAMRIRHWVHVLRAGTLLPQVALIENAQHRLLTSLLRAVLSLRLSRPAFLAALRAHFVFKGKGTFVHPTATVESSVLGSGVQVGAYAYVVNAVLGDHVVVEDRAHIIGSAIGSRTFVSRNSSISFCSVFPDADACTNGIQGCVIGPRCGLTSFARPLDLIPGGRVKVEDQGRLREVGELPCGVAFGPDVFVGADVVIAPGRAIPGGFSLVKDPAQVLRRVSPQEKPGFAWVHEGTLSRPRQKD